ncbi:TadE/TadG family type IV pilus assembly protein [Sandarakinorhabdus glacialis]|nr:TadE/TadG family type IV pilus assembly protein [Polymorphobacter glacialis]
MAAEFALIIPILLVLIFGIFQIGIVFFANAGLKHGLGEAARTATLWPARSDETLASAVRSQSFGIVQAQLENPVVTHGVSQGAPYTEIAVTYTVPVSLLFIDLPSVTLTDRRRVFIP